VEEAMGKLVARHFLAGEATRTKVKQTE